MYETKSEPKDELCTLLIMICQCRFMNYNKYMTLVLDVDSKESGVGGSAGGMWELSVSFTHFYCKHR